MPLPRRIKPALAILAVAALGAVAFGMRATQADKDPPKKGNEARTFEFAPGDLAQLKREPLGRQIPVSGSMKPVLQATIRAKVPAEVTKVHVQEGQAVAAGAAIAALDTGDVKARHDAQLATVAEARARQERATSNRAENKSESG